MTLGQLARAEQVRPPTMTRIVTGLEKAGLVRKMGVARDHRLTKIEATARGQRVLAEGRARRVRMLASSVEALDESDLAELRRGIQLFSEVVASMRAKSVSPQ